MEFDIVEAGNAITRSRRSMEFDIVELGNVGAIATIRRLDTKLKGS